MPRCTQAFVFAVTGLLLAAAFSGCPKPQENPPPKPFTVVIANTLNIEGVTLTVFFNSNLMNSNAAGNSLVLPAHSLSSALVDLTALGTTTEVAMSLSASGTTSVPFSTPSIFFPGSAAAAGGIAALVITATPGPNNTFVGQVQILDVVPAP